jgi:hypothetical protein
MNEVIHNPTSLALAKLFPEGTRNADTLREILLVLGCLAAVSVGLLLWAAYIRKRKRHSSRHSHSSHHFNRTTPGVGTPAPVEKGSEPRRRRHRHRRRRSSSYPLNPTLAQTGGLPPVRRDEPPASPQQTGTQPP